MENSCSSSSENNDESPKSEPKIGSQEIELSSKKDNYLTPPENVSVQNNTIQDEECKVQTLVPEDAHYRTGFNVWGASFDKGDDTKRKRSNYDGSFENHYKTENPLEKDLDQTNHNVSNTSKIGINAQAFSREPMDDNVKGEEDSINEYLSAILNNNPAKRREILSLPVPKHLNSITLKITSKSGLWNKLSPHLTLEDLSGEKFLLNAKKCIQSKPLSKFYKTAYYFHISNLRDCFSKDNEGFMGRIRKKSNTYTLEDHTSYSNMDNDVSTVEFSPDEQNPTSIRKFELTLADRIKRAIIRSSQEEEKADLTRPCLDLDDLEFTSVEPYFDETVNDYAMDFTPHTNFIPSSKNFQVRWKSKDQLLIEQVKVGKNEYELRLRYPMSIFVAFATSLALFDPVYKI
ncbi:unnamed protein product [Moneuplotes crassus]|uniref:Tubby C-terminal domain-containing protein n=1 Tax=Euplotes crassus TaxID=5936 RepID=A0AAD1UFR5_EUPCR|nr:unnamed protein product [Moneuplotes crassus]